MAPLELLAVVVATVPNASQSNFGEMSRGCCDSRLLSQPVIERPSTGQEVVDERESAAVDCPL